MGRRLVAACCCALILAPAAHATAAFTAYVRGGVQYFRTSPANAVDVARVCARRGLRRCGDFITGGDGQQFASDCARAHRSDSDVARALRYWARRARANGARWRVYTFTAAGGYPYSCRVSVVELP